MKTVLLINGLARSGKDTVAKMFYNELVKQKIKTKHLSFAEPLKRIIANTFNIGLYDLESMKNDTERYEIIINDKSRYMNQTLTTNFREILQRFGTEGMKPEFGDNIWARLAYDKILSSNNKFFIISDFRFKIESNEILKLANYDKAHIFTIYVDGGVIPIKESLHISERDLIDFDFDYTILNERNKLKETKEQVNKILEYLV